PFLREGLAVLFLLVLGVKSAYDVSSVMDLGLADEACYMQMGVAIPEHGLPAAEGCPLHGLWYWALSLVQPDRVRLSYLGWSVLAVLVPAGYSLLLRALGGTRAAGLLGAFLVLGSHLVDIYPYPSHLAVVLLTLGGAVALRLRTGPLAGAVLALTLLLAA